jgi:hypothetical protein
LFFALLLLLGPVAAAAGEDSNEHTRGTVTADELFKVFEEIKGSTVVLGSVAQYNDPKFYSRAWLEDAVRTALKASVQSEAPGLNWVEDSLLTNVSSGIWVQSVYGYALVDASPERGWLSMQVVDECQRPSTFTIEFTFEDGAWRISHTKSDSSLKGTAWFRSDLKPVKEFLPVQLRDRSRYINESNLGRSLGLDVKGNGCGQLPGPGSGSN